MAKKAKAQDTRIRQSRREILAARRAREESRRIYLGVAGIAGLILLVLAVAVVNEFALKPGQPVAIVNGRTITSRDFQKRVRYQRAQFISTIDQFYAQTNGNVGLIQQLFGQQMNLLLTPDQFGSLVVSNMIDELLIEDGARERGIVLSDADVQKAIEEDFSYYGGGLPTPVPTATQGPEPTPSLTPIPTAVITEVVPTNTPAPTQAPLPTAEPAATSTPVSAEAFAQSFSEAMQRIASLGGDEATFRAVVAARLYRERLMDALAIEQNLPTEAEQYSFFILTFEDEGDANAALELIGNSDYVTVWNTIRSTPPEPDANLRSARELLWRTQAQVETLLGSGVANELPDLSLHEPSPVLPQLADDGQTISSYHIIYLTGKEVRPLDAGTIDSQKQQALTLWLDSQRQDKVQQFDRWRSRVPTQPALDPRYLVAPTPDPNQPAPGTLPQLPAGPGQ